MKRRKKKPSKPPTKMLLDLASYKKLDLAVTELVQNVDRLHFLVADLVNEIRIFKAENERRSSTAYKAHETRRKNAKKEVETPATGDGSDLPEVQQNDQAFMDLDSTDGTLAPGEGQPIGSE